MAGGGRLSLDTSERERDDGSWGGLDGQSPNLFIGVRVTEMLHRKVTLTRFPFAPRMLTAGARGHGVHPR